MRTPENVDLLKLVFRLRNLQKRQNGPRIAIKVVPIDDDAFGLDELFGDFGRARPMHPILRALLFTANAH